MTRFVSILRGINVSGKNKVLMQDLVSLYESLGLQNVSTYIQSGNVAFDARDGDPKKYAVKIEQAISKQMGLEVPVLVLTHTLLTRLVRNNPFATQPDIDPTKLHITFLEKQPEAARLAQFSPAGIGKDRYELADGAIYLYCPGGYGKTKLSNAWLEKQLGVRATTRNWKTVNVLLEMAGSD